ncbi:TRAP transporter large permease subunit [Shimia sp. R9_1]|uniref:TRAP transporter large permease n=1 Tax=Shimia sp. R9_1 TaxID=2821111 RepID=UPI001AD99514|nr:TRAP transporter large permease subunit [Shimia sp. R9_1]MBO9408293.1 TRAP transporter large permease subunit [Shimia sp. R9_1]
MDALILIGIVLGLLILRQNVILILLVVTAYIQLVWAGGDILYVVEDLWSSMDNHVLLAIPMYIIAGKLMSRGSIARDLIAMVRAATDWMPGGLGIASVLSCALFAAVSGSSAATLLAVGVVMYPALKEAGYTEKFAIGAVTSAGTLGILIPPSIPLIIYGIVTETNVANLFLAGIIPGILLTAIFAIYGMTTNLGNERGTFSVARLAEAVRKGIFALMTPVILLGGIYTGYFSPTEAAAVAVGYAILVELLVYRELSAKDFFDEAVSTAVMLGTLFPIVAVALSLKSVLAIEGIPGAFAEWLQTVISSKIAFLLALNVALLLVGCLIDVVSAVLLLAPVMLAAAQHFGVHPIQLGIIMIINLEIGLLTPPIGLNLLVASGAFKKRFAEVSLSVVPFILLMLLALMMVTFIPELTLYLIK